MLLGTLLLTGQRPVKDYVFSEDASFPEAPALARWADINLVITNGASLSMNAEGLPNLRYITFEGAGGSANIREATARKITVFDRSLLPGGCDCMVNGKDDGTGKSMLRDVTYRRIGPKENPGLDNGAKFISNVSRHVTIRDW